MRDPSEKVVIAYLSPAMLHAAFHRSVVKLLAHDATLHKRIVSGGGDLHVQAGANVSTPRNNLVKAFLEFGRAEWMWMVDSDMSFGPDTVERLLEHADPDTAPIVGGLCFAFDNGQEIVPTLFGSMRHGDTPDGPVKFGRYLDYPADTMFRVVATGTACLLIHRSVFERMQEALAAGHPGFSVAYPWFQETEFRGGPVGEDVTFCLRAGMLDIPVHVNTAIKLGHAKTGELTEEAYAAQQSLTLAKAQELAAVDA